MSHYSMQHAVNKTHFIRGFQDILGSLQNIVICVLLLSDWNLTISAVVCDGMVKDSNVINVLLFGVVHIKVIH